ncbi:MAG: septum site-determining protein MinC [Anaerolineae bacterium]|nr:septum site-determining protein MinC [Anaerolineae bacterium]MDW8293167.1 septum site-determining protein MinC [Anaerolineae bacterium]
MVSIKGLRDGVLIVLNEASGQLGKSLHELETKLKVNPSFFHGSEVVVDVKGALLDEEDLNRVVATLARYGVRLGALASQHEDTLRTARTLGIPIYDPTAKRPLRTERRPLSTALDAVNLSAALAEIENAAAALQAQEGVSEGVLISRRIRSGQVIKHPGHIVIVGDVNPGASLMAGGDVIVWGRLQGSVHAGVLGNDRAIVCALEFAPSVVRIAELTLRNRQWQPQLPQREQRRGWLNALLGSLDSSKACGPAMARVVDQEIVVSPWMVER